MIFISLLNGQVADSGTIFLYSSVLYFIVFNIVYLLLYWIFKIKYDNLFGEKGLFNKNLPFRQLKYILLLLFSTIVCFILIHYLYLQKIPVIKAWLSSDYYEIVNIRRNITRLENGFFRYTSSFMIKAIIPFTLILLHINKKHILYWMLLIIAAFYATSLMQKSFIITVLAPVTFYAFLQLNWLYFGKYVIIIITSIYILLYVSNPDLRNIEVPKNAQIEQNKINKLSTAETNNTFIHAIYKRVTLIPGKMISDWYKHIPKEKPFLNGCGYRFIAPMLDCEFHNYAQELYPVIYPDYAAIGIQGNVNVASFMYDYANFRNKGLVMSGMLLAILFIALELIFKNQFKLKFSLITFYILMLSSSALSTLLLSGGLGLMVLLYFLFREYLHS